MLICPGNPRADDAKCDRTFVYIVYERPRFGGKLLKIHDPIHTRLCTHIIGAFQVATKDSDLHLQLQGDIGPGSNMRHRNLI